MNFVVILKILWTLSVVLYNTPIPLIRQTILGGEEETFVEFLLPAGRRVLFYASSVVFD